MNILRWIAILFFLIVPASAWTINNSNYVFQINNANITFADNQTYDSFAMGANYISLNGSTLQLTPDSQINITINQFQTTNNYYNISFNGSGNTDFAHTVPTAGKYRFINGDGTITDIITVSYILSGTVPYNGLNIVVWSLIDGTSGSVLCSDTNNQLISQSGTTVNVMSLALMILGFGAVFYGWSGRNYTLIVTGISSTIMGFSLLTIGWYILSLFGITTGASC